jgi:hypothetical protein
MVQRFINNIGLEVISCEEIDVKGKAADRGH